MNTLATSASIAGRNRGLQWRDSRRDCTLNKVKKKYITEHQVRSISNIDGNIQDVILWLEAMKKDGWKTIELDWEKDLVFIRQRLETDSELSKRKKKNGK